MNGTCQSDILVEVCDGPADAGDNAIVVGDETIATRGSSGGFSIVVIAPVSPWIDARSHVIVVAYVVVWAGGCS
jgi:hypothetical protein